MEREGMLSLLLLNDRLNFDKHYCSLRLMTLSTHSPPLTFHVCQAAKRGSVAKQSQFGHLPCALSD